MQEENTTTHEIIEGSLGEINEVMAEKEISTEVLDILPSTEVEREKEEKVV
jgi:hypothetical protein